MPKIPYFLQLLLFSSLVAIIIGILKQFFPGNYIHQAIWMILIFYATVTAVIHYLTSNAVNRSDSSFITAILGSMGLKLLLSIAFMVFYLLNNRVNSTWFAVDLIVLYLFFTVFEISSLLRNLRTLKNQ